MWPSCASPALPLVAARRLGCVAAVAVGLSACHGGRAADGLSRGGGPLWMPRLARNGARRGWLTPTCAVVLEKPRPSWNPVVNVWWPMCVLVGEDGVADAVFLSALSRAMAFRLRAAACVLQCLAGVALFPCTFSHMRYAPASPSKRTWTVTESSSGPSSFQAAMIPRASSAT